MQNNKDRITSFLINTRIVSFVLIFLFLEIIVGAIFELLPIKSLEIELLKDKDLVFIFMCAVIIAPLLETLIYQVFIIRIIHYLLSKISINKYIIPILISSLCFGLAHNYSINYIIYGCIVGLIYAIAYCILLRRKENSFMITALIHGCYGLFIFIYKL